MLLILKIIGILILIVLGILLALLLFILFVPIRYKIDGKKEIQSDLWGQIKLSWLMHILSIHILLEKEVSISIKIFGFSVSSKNKNENVKQKGKFEQASKKKQKTNHTKSAKTISNPDGKAKESPHKSTRKSTGKSLKSSEKTVKTQEEKSAFRKKKNIFYKIWGKINLFLNAAKRKYHQFLSSLCQLKYNWTNFVEKKEMLLLVWNNKENQKGISLIWKLTKKLLQHFSPAKWTGTIHFGMNNPETTGKILGLISIFGGIIGILPEIQPDFEKEVFEGKCMLKGRIYIFYLILIFIQLWKKKEIRGLIDNLKEVREELSWQKTI